MQNKRIIVSFLVFFGILLSGCGQGDINNIGTGNKGGGGGTPPSSSKIELSADCSGSDCGNNGNAYTGSGVGVWRAKNSGTSYASLNVALSNVANKEITVVFTNEGSTDVSLPSISVDTSLGKEINIEDDSKKIIHFEREFDFEQLLKRDFFANQNQRFRSISPNYVIGNTKTWWMKPYEIFDGRATTLKKQITSSGRGINFWVEDSEFANNKVTDEMLDNIAGGFNDIYPDIVALAGEPWGTHQYSNLLIESDQPLNIVLANFDKDGEAYGVVGYFWNINNFLDTNELPYKSNEALVLFVDTETLYLGNNGILDTLSTMAHELTHAIHFYQRSVVMEDSFDTFLNEMSAIMMEDILASKIDAYYNSVESRYHSWLRDKTYNCDFTYWKEGYYCDGKSVKNYDVAGSLGAFLLRQHGIDFYKNLFKTRSNTSGNERAKSLNILDRSINGGLGRALQRWGASIALFPQYTSPAGFGYPELNKEGFYLKAFDGNNIRKLPTSSPSTLKANGHFPFLRKTSGNTYTESFTVPPNVSVSVVVK
ncbi:MAG: hypothetical protein LBH45_04040 [Campylobacteraceae bacterium]|nr:hypothetical protein [Campylobacteraceae bacterium]